VGIYVMTGLDPGYLNAGLMKLRKGFTSVAGEKKLRVGKRNQGIDTSVHFEVILFCAWKEI